jgi:hypothetical protein
VLADEHGAAVAARVKMVRVAVPELAPVMLTGLVDPKLRVGRLMASEGVEARTAVRETLPLNPPAGVMVMAEVLPVVAPAAIVTDVPLIENVGGMALVTAITAVAVAAEKLVSPE